MTFVEKRKGELRYRYAVVEATDGAPEQIRNMIGEPDAFLLYKEDRGPESQQDVFDFKKGPAFLYGWVMERRGACVVRGGKVVEAIPEEQIADEVDEEWN